MRETRNDLLIASDDSVKHPMVKPNLGKLWDEMLLCERKKWGGSDF